MLQDHRVEPRRREGFFTELPIPNHVLKGATLHFQWGVVDSTAKGIGLAMSNGGTLKL